ncbi:MAG: S9 family peptidase [Gemmatimonadaceae bacterium]|nr:S9 family peptidase [Gemmatimonadaceae bacterium]MCW5826160.1 S9 family peptidase [Gemmatimonadaceae bacterium]
MRNWYRLSLAALTLPVALAAQAPTPPSPADPYLWLEEVESDRALSWVRERNVRSLGVLESDPRFAKLNADALEILNATDRIPGPSFFGGGISNFWQDRERVRGVWRRSSLESYRGTSIAWETILDVDALAQHEGKNWVFRGGNCLAPDDRYCLLSLSDGGKDAVTIREYDAVDRRFVDGGFGFPEGKQSVAWVDRNTLLVAREWTPGEMTSSGYAYVVKRVTRGQPVERAAEVFRGQPSDVSASGFTLRDADGVVRATMIRRGRTFWESEIYHLTASGTRLLPFPGRHDLNGLVEGRLVFTANEDWNGFKAGDVLSYELETLLRDPAAARAELVLRPGPRESVEGIRITRSRVVVALYENVRGAAYAYRREGNGWTRTRLPLPENVTVGLGSTEPRSDRLFVNVSGYLTPQTLLLVDAAAGTAETVKAAPAKFDATGLVVEQHEATSKDGTKVPYFLVRRADAPRDGNLPTLLYGYGGFQISQLPGYSAVRGKLWLERGGAYAVANTRGGGEFGPAWHQAAIGANRDRAHEDFIAVAQDLIAKRITSPRRLGIQGGSQGGLFMGVAMTRHPELFNAVIIGVPLFDMLRYHLLLAGASWMGEYGNPDIPEQREWILRYSPYQALAAGRNYPEPFIFTSTKDDRVHPGHARKAAARLEELGYPYLYYENIDGGHSAAANLVESARRNALEYTYLTRKLMDTP